MAKRVRKRKEPKPKIARLPSQVSLDRARDQGQELEDEKPPYVRAEDTKEYKSARSVALGEKRIIVATVRLAVSALVRAKNNYIEDANYPAAQATREVLDEMRKEVQSVCSV